jgi:hypothetical protein
MQKLTPGTKSATPAPISVHPIFQMAIFSPLFPDRSGCLIKF